MSTEIQKAISTILSLAFGIALLWVFFVVFWWALSIAMVVYAGLWVYGKLRSNEPRFGVIRYRDRP